MERFAISALVKHALSALVLVVLFYGNAIAFSHHHESEDESPAHEVCEVCLAAATNEDDLLPVELPEPIALPLTLRERQWQFQSKVLNVSLIYDLRETGHSPPREPDQRSDASRAPPQ